MYSFCMNAFKTEYNWINYTTHVRGSSAVHMCRGVMQGNVPDPGPVEAELNPSVMFDHFTFSPSSKVRLKWQQKMKKWLVSFLDLHLYCKSFSSLSFHIYSLSSSSCDSYVFFRALQACYCMSSPSSHCKTFGLMPSDPSHTNPSTHQVKSTQEAFDSTSQSKACGGGVEEGGGDHSTQHSRVSTGFIHLCPLAVPRSLARSRYPYPQTRCTIKHAGTHTVCNEISALFMLYRV